MYEVKTNALKNRLYISVDGAMVKNEVELYKSTVKKNVQMLKPGFTVAIDLRKTSVVDQETLLQMQEIKKIAVSAGLSKSAVVMDSAILKMQTSRSFKDVGPQDKPFTSLEEAEKFLDEK